jgi:hypothetical protein
LQQPQFSLERRGVTRADVSHVLPAMEAIAQAENCLFTSRLAAEESLPRYCAELFVAHREAIQKRERLPRQPLSRSFDRHSADLTAGREMVATGSA